METSTFPNQNVVLTSTGRSKSGLAGAFLMLLSLVLFSLGCAKDKDVALVEDESNPVNITNPTDEITTRAITNNSFKQVNLVSDLAEFAPARLDSNLKNAWGIAFDPSQKFWITSAHADKAVIYDHEGGAQKTPLEIEGDPIGIVYNSSSGFKIPGTSDVARFIFATEETGQIVAWTPWEPNEVVTVIDNSGFGAEYTGLEIAQHKGNWFIYAANVGAGTIDVYDRFWNLVTNMPFSDPTLPNGASPFNIRLISGFLYVTYVGPGGGYVNIFRTDGTFVKRFASGGTLAAPWGITKVPLAFGIGHAILVGNFGDGRINVYSYAGQFKGQLEYDDGTPVVIDGLWALTFLPTAFNSVNNGIEDATLYFAAGPNDEENGLFGYLVPAD